MTEKATTDQQPLHNVRFFQGLDSAALAMIAQASRKQRAPRDAFFFTQDEPATTFYVLIAGQARLSQITPEGRQVILGFVGPNQEVGIVAAIEQATYPLSLQAVTDCEALAWGSAALVRLLEQYPILALRALRMVTGRFVQLQNRYRELATERVERRIARALLRLVEQAGQCERVGVRIDLPLSRQDLAEMTGTTLYTVSRTLSQWERQGFLETGRERVLIRVPQELNRIAEDLPEASSS
ncbi:MAG: Crp/Fnr family transcriptional regulator [Chloroflexales bacterium]|nr:Crp/Fnr family transcriptional regulator [Chloroflexales bacterium]